MDLVEGGNRKRPYIITGPNGRNSGVTIGRGVDLSRWTSDNLFRAGIDRDTRLALQPFLAPGPGRYGPTGTSAAQALTNSGLSSYEFDARTIDTLNAMAHANVWAIVEARYNSQNSFGATFSQLPEAVQTSVFSLFYNIGPNAAAPNFLGHIGAGRFADAAVELRTGWSSNPTRRDQEANLLSTAIQNGKIPALATQGRC